jgi:protein ImuA
LAELGGRPDNLFLIKTAHAADALAAASDILACPHVGALLLEISGHPKALDLVASRRLNFLAAETGASCILLREGAEAFPSAAQTRWHVSSASSEGDDWGLPAFTAELSRNRLGPTGCWRLTWNPEDGFFREPGREQYAPNDSSQKNFGRVAAASFDRPVEEKRRIAF